MLQNITKYLKVIPQGIKLVRNMSGQSSQKIAVCQMTSTNDKQANLQVVEKLIADASNDDAKMIFLPEDCDYIAANKEEVVSFAEPILGGATVNVYRELARKHNVWLSMGGLHEKDANNSRKVFNTHIIIDDKGSIVQAYRKLHLFDVEIPEKNVRLKESDFANGGAHIVTPVDTPVGRVGMAICYDLRFPELSTHLASMGAEILTYPSAFTYATGEAHWEILLRSRAIETQCYVIAAAQVGYHHPKRRSYGHAMCVDPWGGVAGDCGGEGTGYRIVEVDMDKLAEVRRSMPVLQHRSMSVSGRFYRRDVYSLYALSLRQHLLPEHYEQSRNASEQVQRTFAGPMNVFGHVRVAESCVFYRSKFTYAFVNLRCVTPGHVLVAPIRLAERNEDLTEEEAADFYKTIRLVQRLMEKVHNTQSCTVTIQDGVHAGQTVKHLHCHIMPRKKGDFIENDLIYLELAKHDHLEAGHPSKPARTIEEMEAEAAALREYLKTINFDRT